MQTKLMGIETAYNTGTISEEEATVKKVNIKQEADFFKSMEGVNIFMSGNEKIKIFIFSIIIAGGIFIDIFLRGAMPLDAIKAYMLFIIGAGIFFILPSLLQAIAVGIIALRVAGSMPKYKEEKIE
jgi:flagellar biosynthesis protein FlhA